MKVDEKHLNALANIAHLKFKNNILGVKLCGLTDFEKELYKAGYRQAYSEIQ